jgi:hypothetical protein
MLHTPEYWRALAKGIDAEEAKASIFLHHKHSVGAAREAILRDLLVKHTPEPYRVGTGFIHQYTPERWESRQCDVLVYDPSVSQPDYAIGGLVVVNRPAARLVIEVKTGLDGDTFQQTLGIHSSVSWLRVPTLGFAYDGWSFETFLGYLARAIKTEQAGVPDCLAVHGGNYLFVRSYYRLALREDAPGRHRPAVYQFAVNFGKCADNEGRASATFLDVYLKLLRKELDDSYLARWFASLQLPAEALVRITDDGEVQYGIPPVEQINE